MVVVISVACVRKRVNMCRNVMKYTVSSVDCAVYGHRFRGDIASSSSSIGVSGAGGYACGYT